MITLVDRAHDHLHHARAFCKIQPGQTAGMLSDVTNAMAQSFQGTGHWCYCANGRPFTVGECGMPMKTARCPQCGAIVGVTPAADLEADFGRR